MNTVINKNTSLLNAIYAMKNYIVLKIVLKKIKGIMFVSPNQKMAWMVGKQEKKILLKPHNL